jgi:hypothetical protein
MPYDRQRTVYIDGPQSDLWRTTALFSDFNIHECNLMLFDPQCLMTTWAGISLQATLSGNKESPKSYRRRWDTAFYSILRWIEEGNTLLVIVRSLPAMELLLGDGKKITEEPNLWEPFSRITPRARTGALVEPAPAFTQEFSPFRAAFSYNYVLEGAGLLPLYRTSSTNARNQETVAGYCRQGHGVIVFMPKPNLWTEPYLDATTALKDRRDRPEDELPDWATRFQVIDEQSALGRIANAQNQIQAAQLQIEQEQTIVAYLRKSKVLYAGTGAILVEETAVVLREFGLNVVEGPHPRADLLIWNGSRLAAAEIKGLEGAAREADLRQVNAWVAEVNRTLSEDHQGRKSDPVLIQYEEKLTELGIDVSSPILDLECQGIMIIGTFRKTPLDTRPAESFPHPVAKLIERFDVCALTGLDLYCLFQELKTNPSRKQKIAEGLFAIRGVMPARNWRQFIETF